MVISDVEIVGIGIFTKNAVFEKFIGELPLDEDMSVLNYQ